MNDDRANDTCAEATIDDLPRDAEGRVILDPAGVVEDRDGRGITTLARGLSFEGLKAELTRIHEALDAPTRAIALQVWESAARAAAAMAPNPAANEEEPLTIRGDLGATVTAFLEAGPDLTATFPSQPSPVPASPKDAVASPSAAQTVAHTVRSEPVDDTTLEREIERALNRHSAENASNTPDYILAQFLLGCLSAWNTGVQRRETWYGRDARPSLAAPPNLPEPPNG